MNRLMPWLQLLRLPTVFTALADIMLGFLLTHVDLSKAGDLAGLLVSSACLYLAGMVFNDVCDRNSDRELRPERPIPSGRISVKAATALGGLLLIAGCGAAAWVGVNSLKVAGMLSAVIIAYDAVLKRTWLGPLAMGGCRFLNVMLGASAIGLWNSVWTAVQVPFAIGLGVYVCGLTWFARREASGSRPRELTAAAIVINLGIAILAASVVYWGYRSALSDTTRVLMALGVILLVVDRRLLIAIASPVQSPCKPP